MNQILSIEQPNPKKEKKEKKEKKQKNKMPKSSGGQIEIAKIVRFFSIVLIIFGIIMVGSGSYSMYQNTQTGNSNAKPTIYVEEVSETQLNLQVTHDSSLQKVTYSWNDGDSVELNASGKKSVEQLIEIPTGENTLYVYAVDQEGRETNYSRVYTREGDITINFEVDGSNLLITASGKNELSYMTYRWDDEEEERIDINSTETEQSIEIPMGQHTLTVAVVDVNNTTETKEQEVKGVTKPTVEVTTDGSSNFIIKASDDEGITRIEFILNDTNKAAIDLDRVYPDAEDRKEFEYYYPMIDGENRLEVTVYNESGVSETVKVMVSR